MKLVIPMGREKLPVLFLDGKKTTHPYYYVAILTNRESRQFCRDAWELRVTWNFPTRRNRAERAEASNGPGARGVPRGFVFWQEDTGLRESVVEPDGWESESEYI